MLAVDLLQDKLQAKSLRSAEAYHQRHLVAMVCDSKTQQTVEVPTLRFRHPQNRRFILAASPILVERVPGDTRLEPAKFGAATSSTS